MDNITPPDVGPAVLAILNGSRMDANASRIKAVLADDSIEMCHACPDIKSWAERYFEAASALADALDELSKANEYITALKAIIAEDNKTFDELEDTEQVAFLQKHFGLDWTKHISF